MKKSGFILLFISVFILLLSQANGQLVVAEPEEPLAPAAASPNWETAEKISVTSGITDAVQPTVGASANGSKVIVVYNGIINDVNADRDVFYAKSTDFGNTWPSKGRIHLSPGLNSDSFLVDIAITPNSKGHAVWQELVNSIPRIVYKYEDNWGNNSTNLITISNATNPVIVSEPSIVAKSNNRLDVVWAQGEPSSNINIYHAYSLNSNGSSWQGQAPIADTSPVSRLPDMTIDASGNYHVVWEERTSPKTIYYLRGVPSGNTVNWSTAAPINISQRSITNGTNAAQPRIFADGNVLHVTYTNYVDIDHQYVHHLQCNSGCSNVANWISVGNPISGQVLAAKATDPFDVISTIGQVGRCTYVYFHGIQGTSSSGTERVWGVNSCGNWAASARDQVTDTSIRAIYPSMASANDWWLFMAYEQVNTSGTLREVYFTRNQPAIFLPSVFK